MSDDSTLRDIEAASAAVDGDPVALERVDPRLVEALRSVRAELAAVPPAPDAVRDAAIRAALAATTDAGAAGTTAATSASAVVSIAARRRQRRIYTVAGALAAAAIVAIIGVAALVNRSDDSTDSATAKVDQSLDAELNTAAAPPELAGGRQPTPTTTVTRTVPAAAPTTGGGTATTVSPDAGSAAGAGDHASTTVAAPFPINSPAGLLPMVDTPAALRAFVQERDTHQQEPSVPTLSTACDLTGLDVIGAISYAGQPALAVRVPSSGTIRAIDVERCVVLAEVPGA